MRISKIGIDLIKSFEGCKIDKKDGLCHAYLDSADIPTIGWGTTSAVKSITGKEIKLGMTITPTCADAWLEMTIEKLIEPKVQKYDKIYHWNQNQYDAMCSYSYNIGSIDALCNDGKRTIAEISADIPNHNRAKVNGILQPVAGLTRRRKAEKELFDTPVVEKNASMIMAKAISYLGTKEQPAGSNNVIFNTDYYGRPVSGNAYPWCCAYVWDIFRMCDMSNLFNNGLKTAYCPTVESWGKTKKLTVDKNKGDYGDIVLFDFTGKGIAGHIGFIEKRNPDGSYVTVEGNTSMSSNDNGGCVMRRNRKQSQIRCIIRPQYQAQSTPQTSEKPIIPQSNPLLKKGSKGQQVIYLQVCLNYLGCGNLIVDGDFGNNTYTALKKFQSKYSLEVDGIYGQKSRSKMMEIINGMGEMIK